MADALDSIWLGLPLWLWLILLLFFAALQFMALWSFAKLNRRLIEVVDAIRLLTPTRSQAHADAGRHPAPEPMFLPRSTKWCPVCKHMLTGTNTECSTCGARFRRG